MTSPEHHDPVPSSAGIAPPTSPARAVTGTAAWWAGRAHPVWTAVVLVAVPVAVTVVIGLAGTAIAGTGDDAQLVSRLVAVLAVAVAALVVVARAGAWRRTGAAGPATWRHVGLLVVPTAVALAPLVTGLEIPAGGTLAILVVGYLATGVFEEVWHRGVIQDTLRMIGLRRGAVIGGALFGASHLANVVFGQAPAVSAAQAFGAFCFGIGFSVFRWRTNAVWLLAAVHALGDLMFKVTPLHGGTLWGFLVGHDTLMLLWGLWCLRGVPNDLPAELAPLG